MYNAIGWVIVLIAEILVIMAWMKKKRKKVG